MDRTPGGCIYMSENVSRQRIGLYGGTFDPIHIGHLLVAEQVCEKLRLDYICFLPAATAPHKLGQKSVDGKHRLEMVQLATGGNPRFRVDDRELRRGGTSYTVDTLSELTQEQPSQDFVLIIGNDSLDDLHTWRDPARICELAFVAVVARGGQAPPDLHKLLPYLPESERANLASHLVSIPQIEISSTEIRSNILHARSIRYQLHPAVEAYIAANGLYQS
jgi:nicotinate-nucleotide adenylyltransferase